MAVLAALLVAVVAVAISGQTGTPGPPDIATVAWMRRAARSGQARALREQAGISGAEMARQLGVSAAAFSLWERGFRRPNAIHAQDWARLLRDLAA